MRARISRHVQAAWLGAMAFVVGTLLLFDRGSYVLGAVALVPTALMTWLAGVWVVPRGVDAYQRRVARALRDWRAASAHSWDRAALKRGTIVARLAGLDVPPRFAERHRRAVDRLLAADRLRTDRSMSFAERARRAAEAREELRALAEQTTSLAADAGERRYADAFAAALRERDDVYRKAAGEVEALTEGALAKLNRMRVPVEWSARHSDIERRLAAHLDASRRLHATVDGATPAAREAAAGDFERAQDDLFGFLERSRAEFVAYWKGLSAIDDHR
jgi:hypothetical protein